MGLVFQRYDSDQDGRLGLWEFSNALLPIDTILREEVEGRRTCYDMSFETRELMITVFRKSVDFEAAIEQIRYNLHREMTTGLRQVFEQLDWLNRGFLTKAEVKRVIDLGLESCENRGEALAQSHLESIEMEALFRRFNKDKMNGKISMLEFIDELTQKIM